MKISDRELYKICQECGGNARKWMKEFAYYLPEVAKRSLHRRKGFESIYQFAAQVAGMNFEVCKSVLQLGEKFENMPLLWEQIRMHGWSKLRVVASVVTPETEAIWIKNMNRCTKAGLEKIVKKFKSVPEKKCKDGVVRLSKGNTQMGISLGENVPCGDRADFDDRTMLKFKVDDETEFQFKKFKYELEKKNGRAMTMGEVLKKLLDGVETVQPKPRKTRKIIKVTRQMRVAEKREIEEKQNDRCFVEDCNELATEFHHSKRYALSRSHDGVVKLCRCHHQLAHAGFIDEVGDWLVDWQVRDRKIEVEEIDEKVRIYWQL